MTWMIGQNGFPTMKYMFHQPTGGMMKMQRSPWSSKWNGLKGPGLCILCPRLFSQTKWQGCQWKSSYWENNTSLWYAFVIPTSKHQHRHYNYHHHHHHHILPVSTRQSPCTIQSATCLYYRVHKWLDRFQPVWRANHWTTSKSKMRKEPYSPKQRRSNKWSHDGKCEYTKIAIMLLDQLYLSLCVSRKNVRSV